MSAHTVVINDCLAVAVVGGPTNIRTRRTPHGDQNFQLNVGHVTAGLPRVVTAREQDWIETAGHLFAVDLACRRGAGDVGWQREIEAYLPVRDPDHWNDQAVQIQEIFGDFTGDRLRLRFVQDDLPDDPPRQREDPFSDHDCVALVSGGVDSCVGAAKLIADGRRPLAVSHTAAGAITHAQAEVEGFLKSRSPDFERLGITARKSGASFPSPEPSQRSRTFFFLAVACLAAAVGGSNEVFINENGIMAIHLPMTAARVGSLSTHTASPAIIERFQRLARNVLEAPVTISNNILHLTKPDVVELGLDLDLSDKLASTVSCWSIGRTSQHCGSCAPCLMRRISFEIHDTQDADYKSDAFEDTAILDNEVACDNLTHLVRIAADLERLTDLQLQIGYPELLNGGQQLPLPDNISLHRRWGTQSASILSRHSVPVGLR